MAELRDPCVSAVQESIQIQHTTRKTGIVHSNRLNQLECVSGVHQVSPGQTIFWSRCDGDVCVCELLLWHQVVAAFVGDGG